MSTAILLYAALAIVLGVIANGISRRHEKRLRQAGAVEYGRLNTTLSMVSGGLWFVAMFVEGFLRGTQFDGLTVVGIVIHVLAMVALFYVIYALGDLWTTRVLIAPEHRLVTNWLFRTVKHPNYFLGVIPQFIGLTLIFKAWIATAIFGPIVVVLLAWRIKVEEQAMKDAFPEYRGVRR